MLWWWFGVGGNGCRVDGGVEVASIKVDIGGGGGCNGCYGDKGGCGSAGGGTGTGNGDCVHEADDGSGDDVLKSEL